MGTWSPVTQALLQSLWPGCEPAGAVSSSQVSLPEATLPPVRASPQKATATEAAPQDQSTGDPKFQVNLLTQETTGGS